MAENWCHSMGAARVRWWPRPDGLEESVQFFPGYNCPVMTMKGHGVHGMEIVWLLRGPLGAVQLGFGTDWIPGKVGPGHGVGPDGIRSYQRYDGLWSSDPYGRGLGAHHRRAVYEGHKMAEQCEVIGGACYYDEQLSGADTLVPVFMADGEQAIWDKLEAVYSELAHV